MGWRARIGGVGLVCISVWGCSFLVDTSGLGGPGDGPSTDAADAPSLVDATDGGGTSLDGATDAKFCSAHADATACIDFDDGGTVTSYLSSSVIDPRVTYRLDTSVFMSAPASLSYDFTGGTLSEGTMEHAFRRASLVSAQRSARASARLRIDRVDAMREVRSLELLVRKNGGFVTAFLHASSSRSVLFLQVYDANLTNQKSVSIPFVAPIPVGAWATVEILMDLVAGKATAFLDGNPATSPLLFDAALAADGTPELELALTRYGTAGEQLAATTFHYDDVLLEAE